MILAFFGDNNPFGSVDFFGTAWQISVYPGRPVESAVRLPFPPSAQVAQKTSASPGRCSSQKDRPICTLAAKKNLHKTPSKKSERQPGCGRATSPVPSICDHNPFSSQ